GPFHLRRAQVFVWSVLTILFSVRPPAPRPSLRAPIPQVLLSPAVVLAGAGELGRKEGIAAASSLTAVARGVSVAGHRARLVAMRARVSACRSVLPDFARVRLRGWPSQTPLTARACTHALASSWHPLWGGDQYQWSPRGRSKLQGCQHIRPPQTRP